MRLPVPRGGEQVSSLLGYGNGERKPTAADRLANLVEEIVELNPHFFYLTIKDKQYVHERLECDSMKARLIKALADARSEEAK